jgi:hypothetical protein
MTQCMAEKVEDDLDEPAVDDSLCFSLERREG